MLLQIKSYWCIMHLLRPCSSNMVVLIMYDIETSEPSAIYLYNLICLFGKVTKVSRNLNMDLQSGCIRVLVSRVTAYPKSKITFTLFVDS